MTDIKINLYSTGWTQVQREVYIDADQENSILEIKDRPGSRQNPGPGQNWPIYRDPGPGQNRQIYRDSDRDSNI